MNRQFQRISKATYKFHVHFRLHSNLYINYLNHQLKKDFSVVINGLDLNVVKPKGRFHSNMGLMLKNFLILFNLDKMQRTNTRSVFDGPPKGSAFSEKESVRPSQGQSDFQQMLDSAFVDYRRFKLNIDITTEEHISGCLIPILTVTGESGDLLIRSSEAVIRKILEIQIAIAKEDLAAFHKASRGMNQSMTYNMSNAIKKIVKSNKGVNKVTKSFLDTLENVGSFSREKIPLPVLRRLYAKRYLTPYSFGSPTNPSHSTAYVSLKKTDPAAYSRHKAEYQTFIKQRMRERELKKKKRR